MLYFIAFEHKVNAIFKPEVSAAVDVLYLLAAENSKRLESKNEFNIYNFVCGLLVFKLIMKYILTCSSPYVMQIFLNFLRVKKRNLHFIEKRDSLPQICFPKFKYKIVHFRITFDLFFKPSTGLENIALIPHKALPYS